YPENGFADTLPPAAPSAAPNRQHRVTFLEPIFWIVSELPTSMISPCQEGKAAPDALGRSANKSLQISPARLRASRRWFPFDRVRRSGKVCRPSTKGATQYGLALWTGAAEHS